MATPTDLRDRHEWTLELDSFWDVLGPFPIHAREQHFISPSFPLNLSKPIDYGRLWPSSYSDGGFVGWSKASMVNGTTEISFPEIRWKSLRATEGWAALQHHATLRTTLTVHPTMEGTPLVPPRLLVDVKQGSYFALRPQVQDLSGFVPEWYAGNIYDMERALPHVVELPVHPSLVAPTKYDIFVSGDYEIRLFGDPLLSDSDIPVQQLEVSVKLLDASASILRHPSQDVSCDFLSGYAFGNSIGVGMQSLSNWWSVKSIRVLDQTASINLKLPFPVTIAPYQMRIIPIIIEQAGPYLQKAILFEIVLVTGEISETLSISLPVKHHSRLEYATGMQSLRATYTLVDDSMPTSFLAVPPKTKSETSGPPILALHGAGVDVIGQDFWVNSLPENNHSWLVIPTGRTSWGLDWHGPSAADAWASLDALRSILDELSKHGFTGLSRIPPDSKSVIIGHSNGGQGTWYLASRYPDRVLAAIPAAGYIKSQAYIPLNLARSGHFIDPALRSILESSLTPDDNDLHLSNLVDIRMLAIHGGSDPNVPVWHTREAVGVLKTWYPSHKIALKEDTGQLHWYSSVFKNPTIQSFIDRMTSEFASASLGKEKPSSFTLTVTTPHASGFLRGWKVDQLRIPGRMGQLRVHPLDDASFWVKTSNIQRLSIQPSNEEFTVIIDNTKFVHRGTKDTIHMCLDFGSYWKLVPASEVVRSEAPGRLQAILTTSGVISIIISDTISRQEYSLALRLAHILHLYHRLDSEIISESIASNRLNFSLQFIGNIIFIGTPTSPFAQEILSQNKTPVKIQDQTIHVGDKILAKPGQAIIFTHPHPDPHSTASLMLFMIYNDATGLERAARLFPYRTGIAVPDWVIVGNRMDTFGAGGIDGAGLWTVDWNFNGAMSWLH